MASPRQSILSISSPSTLFILLLADTPNPAVSSAHGSYHDIFTSLFTKSLGGSSTATAGDEGAQAGGKLTIESYDVVKGLYPTAERLREAKGLLITGSASSAYLPVPWIVDLIAYAKALPELSPSLKIIGICFGHQILALAFGGTVHKNDLGWEIGVRHCDLSELGQKIFGGNQLLIHQMHQDIVPSSPPSFPCLASTSVCSVQGFVRLVPSASPSTTAATIDPTLISILTLQGHPEFVSDIVNKIIDARECGGVIDEELATASREYAKESEDGIRIGRVILGMLGV